MSRLEQCLAGILVLSLAGCVTENVSVNLPPYEPQAVERKGQAEPSAKLRVEAVKDARGDAVGSLVGQRTTFDKPMGGIELNPPPTSVIAQVLRTELAQMGYSVVDSSEEFTVAAQLRKFQVVTPNTALYWDINGAIELDLAVTARGGKKFDARYAVTCTDRTYVYPSEEIIGNVVSACVGSLGAKVRGDATLSKFIGDR